MTGDVVISAPTAVADSRQTRDAPTKDDVIALLNVRVGELEQQVRTRDIALETTGIVLACALHQLLEGSGVDTVVFERAFVRKMMESRPDVNVSERSDGDTAVRLRGRNPDLLSVGG